MAVTVEGKLQSEAIRWLKSKGAYVIKTKPGPGIPTGCPDVIFLFEGAWGVIEFKSARNAPFRPGQKPTLEQLRGWSPFVYVAYPENWSQVKTELARQFF